MDVGNGAHNGYELIIYDSRLGERKHRDVLKGIQELWGGQNLVPVHQIESVLKA